MIRIREEREKLGYTLQELADILGIAPNTLHNYEHTKRHPNVEMLIKLADIFNCSIDYLVCRVDTRYAQSDKDCKDIDVFLNKKCLSQLTINDVKTIMSALDNVGFDLDKLMHDKRT